MPTAQARDRRRSRVAFAALFGLAAAQHLWNAFTVPPLIGYDAVGHAGYVVTILEEGRLPHPLLGWSSFHPPFYYLLAAGLWWLLDPLGVRAVVAGLRLPGVVGNLAAGVIVFGVLRRRGYGLAVVCVATALALFVPAAQMAAVMEGNEALATGLVALALAAALRLQERPDDARMAALAGAAAGLAMATKYSGALAAAAAALPFLVAVGQRRRLERGVARAALVYALALAALGAPTYVRNLALTGSPTPMTKKFEPMWSMEQSMVLRERRLLDFVWLPAGCLRRPSLFQEEGKAGWFTNRNPVMTSIWCLTYASAWTDAFAHRIPVTEHRDERWLGPALAALGIAPTAVMLIGFGAALAAFLRRRAASWDAPLVLMTLLGVALHIVYTAGSPSASAVKASYLLGLVLPAAAFFARAAALLPRSVRAAALTLSGAAALVCALVFTHGVAFEPNQMKDPYLWYLLADELPYSHMRDALDRLVGPWYR